MIVEACGKGYSFTAARKQTQNTCVSWLSPFSPFIPSGPLAYGMVLPTFVVRSPD
jgi:hypothetical protein